VAFSRDPLDFCKTLFPFLVLSCLLSEELFDGLACFVDGPLVPLIDLVVLLHLPVVLGPLGLFFGLESGSLLLRSFRPDEIRINKFLEPENGLEHSDTLDAFAVHLRPHSVDCLPFYVRTVVLIELSSLGVVAEEGKEAVDADGSQIVCVLLRSKTILF